MGKLAAAVQLCGGLITAEAVVPMVCVERRHHKAWWTLSIDSC
jgi:hypothetical protein